MGNGGGFLTGEGRGILTQKLIYLNVAWLREIFLDFGRYEKKICK